MSGKSIWLFIDSAITRFTNWLTYGAIFCITVQLALGTLDIIGTKFFSMPIPGTLNYIEELNVALVFLALGYVTVERGHITILVIENKISRGFRNALYGLGYILSFLLGVFLSWRSFILLETYIVESQLKSGIFQFPLWPFALTMFLGFTFMTIGFILVFIRMITGLQKPAGESPL